VGLLADIRLLSLSPQHIEIPGLTEESLLIVAGVRGGGPGLLNKKKKINMADKKNIATKKDNTNFLLKIKPSSFLLIKKYITNINPKNKDKNKYNNNIMLMKKNSSKKFFNKTGKGNKDKKNKKQLKRLPIEKIKITEVSFFIFSLIDKFFQR